MGADHNDLGVRVEGIYMCAREEVCRVVYVFYRVGKEERGVRKG